jgi:YIF1
MAYLTYILLYGIAKGLLAKDFHPNMLYDAGAFAFLIVVLEVAVMKATYYMFSSATATTAFWDHVAIATYKFVHLSVAVAVRIGLGSKSEFYWVVFAYCSVAAALTCYFSLQASSSAINVLSGGMDISPTMSSIVIGTAALQVPICWLLQPSAG